MPRNALLLIGVFGIVVLMLMRWNNYDNNRNRIIGGDGWGYYAYLPAIIIHQDLSYKNVLGSERRLLNSNDYYPVYLVRVSDQEINKYPIWFKLYAVTIFLTGSSI